MRSLPSPIPSRSATKSKFVCDEKTNEQGLIGERTLLVRSDEILRRLCSVAPYPRELMSNGGLQLPERLLKRMSDLGIREHHLVEKFIAGSGPGGQKINKTANCVSLRHLPTGIEIQCQSERSLTANREIARLRLCEQIEAYRKKVQLEKGRLRAKKRFQKRKPSAAEKKRRRKTKEQRSEKKAMRKKVEVRD
ncbi:MAG: peptide chain release factor-like protein [Verrucomicrobiales bacterium]|nr:peptide chain release factor-like protein [Verrucomicrobiales bacterium]